MRAKSESNDRVGLTRDQFVNQDALRPLGPSPPFRELCKVLDSVNFIKSKEMSRRLHRRECLKQFFTLWRQYYGNDLYPCARLLLPHRDRERSSYFLRESGLGRLYINALGLDKQTSAARQILEWKRVSKDDEKPVLNYRPPIILCR